MRKFSIFGIFVFLFAIMAAESADAATAQRGGAAAPAASGGTATRGRAPAAAPVATSNSAPATAPVTSARSGTVAVRAPVAARSGTTPVAAAPVAAAPVVAARAGTTQKVIQTGTNIAAATSSAGVVDPACRERFFGCMDSFCMIDNDNGGRCQCSDRKAELDKALQEIERLDNQSYKLATEGVERMELGETADQIFKSVADTSRLIQAGTSSALPGSSSSSVVSSSARRRIGGSTIDLSMWDNDWEFEEENAFSASSADTRAYDISGKSGTALYQSVDQICAQQMAGCEKDAALLRTMYTTNVQSDCRAYENALKTRQQASERKLLAAQAELRAAALEAFENANRWDLGQCVVQFRSCMATTGGCGTDFSNCVGWGAAQDAVANRVGTQTTIAGTSISILQTTMETLNSKKPLCDSITLSCMNARDKVWGAFLSEIAPTLKAAEVGAEDSLRRNCISNISTCFQEACVDRFDPNNPDGSYDMCLTRPEILGSVCKTVVDPCESVSANIMDFVRARLAGMRVDSCTKQVKECLTSEDRCGSDYSQCIGLDTDAIIGMCPYDKLVGCQQVYGDVKVTEGDAVYNNIANMIQGLILAIDNNALGECQKVADEAMAKVCGAVSECPVIDDDMYVGTGGLTISGKTINGKIDFSKFKKADNGEGLKYDGDANSSMGVQSILNTADRYINELLSDTRVKYCTEGRTVQGLRTTVATRGSAAAEAGRFPYLMDKYATIIRNSIVARARDNQNYEYGQMMIANAENDYEKCLATSLTYYYGLLISKIYTTSQTFTCDMETFTNGQDLTPGPWDYCYQINPTTSALEKICDEYQENCRAKYNGNVYFGIAESGLMVPGETTLCDNSRFRNVIPNVTKSCYDKNGNVVASQGSSFTPDPTALCGKDPSAQ